METAKMPREYYSAIKKNGILSFASKWMEHLLK
jgi:hypothetical protein